MQEKIKTMDIEKFEAARMLHDQLKDYEFIELNANMPGVGLTQVLRDIARYLPDFYDQVKEMEDKFKNEVLSLLKERRSKLQSDFASL